MEPFPVLVPVPGLKNPPCRGSLTSVTDTALSNERSISMNEVCCTAELLLVLFLTARLRVVRFGHNYFPTSRKFEDRDPRHGPMVKHTQSTSPNPQACCVSPLTSNLDRGSTACVAGTRARRLFLSPSPHTPPCTQKPSPRLSRCREHREPLLTLDRTFNTVILCP